MINEKLMEKWDEVVAPKDGVIGESKVPVIEDSFDRRNMAIMLENTEQYSKNIEDKLLSEATPTNVSGGIATFDKILIPMVRRGMPNLVSKNFIGTQAMQASNGQIFALKTRYTNQAGAEALGLVAPDTAFSGRSSDGSAGHTTPVASDTEENPFTTYTTGTASTTAQGEADILAEMALTIDKVSMNAQERALKATLSVEMIQDMKAYHGLDATRELQNLVANELVSEIDQHILRTLKIVAKEGAQGYTTDGIYDMNTDSDGRWFNERVKDLIFMIGKESNEIYFDTRRGVGNFLLVSANVAAALGSAGMLDYQSGITGKTGLRKINGPAFVGNLLGQWAVYIDPWVRSVDFVMVGYFGGNFDAGFFHAPYTPLTLQTATDPLSLQPILGYRTRYGLVNNPFVVTAGGVPVGEDMAAAAGRNQYYRLFQITDM